MSWRADPAKGGWNFPSAAGPICRRRRRRRNHYQAGCLADRSTSQPAGGVISFQFAPTSGNHLARPAERASGVFNQFANRPYWHISEANGAQAADHLHSYLFASSPARPLAGWLTWPSRLSREAADLGRIEEPIWASNSKVARYSGGCLGGITRERAD